jgi:hypothetical protein
VPIYRFYIFEKDALVAAPPKIYDLPNDAAALEAARTINGHAVEVWCNKRKIGRLNPHDQPRLAKPTITKLAARRETQP